MKFKKCPLCDSKKIREKTSHVTRQTSGRKVIVPNVTYWYCSHCRQKIFSPPALQKMEEFLKRRTA